MDEKKYLNGNLTRKLCFGLSWFLNIAVIGWILALFTLIVDKKELSLEDRRELVSVIASSALRVVINVIPVIGQIASLVFLVFEIIAGVKALKGETFQVPGAYHIAVAIIKE